LKKWQPLIKQIARVPLTQFPYVRAARAAFYPKQKGEGFNMIRKILKWIGIVLGSLIGLLVLAFGVLYVIGSVKWNGVRGKDYDVLVETITIPTDQASIARGEHIATIRMCKDCHTENLSDQHR
jgi:hypothetical protein